MKIVLLKLCYSSLKIVRTHLFPVAFSQSYTPHWLGIPVSISSFVQGNACFVTVLLFASFITRAPKNVMYWPLASLHTTHNPSSHTVWSNRRPHIQLVHLLLTSTLFFIYVGLVCASGSINSFSTEKIGCYLSFIIPSLNYFSFSDFLYISEAQSWHTFLSRVSTYSHYSSEIYIYFSFFAHSLLTHLFFIISC